jgi:hypothetical protein
LETISGLVTDGFIPSLKMAMAASIASVPWKYLRPARMPGIEASRHFSFPCIVVSIPEGDLKGLDRLDLQ